MIRTPQTAGGTEVPMTGGETQQGGAPNYSLIVKGFIGLVVVLAIGFFLANSFSGNDAGESDQKKPEKIPENKIDPVSGGVAGVGIVTGNEVSDDTSKEVPGKIGESYPVDNIPKVLLPRSYMLEEYTYLNGLQVLDLRYEDGKFKFCIKNSERHQDEITLKISAGGFGLEHIKVSAPKNKRVCYETSVDLREHDMNPQEVQIRIFR